MKVMPFMDKMPAIQATKPLIPKIVTECAVYIAFGEGQGKMHGKLMDVHGTGYQRSDPKSGNSNYYPQFFGPQGDVI